MTLLRKQSSPAGLLVEYAAVVLVLLSLAWLFYFFHTRHFLPQPFIYDVNDTFMDWFSTAAYANRPGAFDVWRTVYPPLSFVFLRLVSIHACYGDPFTARNCDWFGIATILASYATDCGLAACAFWRRNPATALPRSLAFAFGLPLLFALERGNLVLVCLIPFILAYGEMLGSSVSRAVAIATTVNFKPYLVIPAVALAVRRDWRGLEWAALATLALYLVTYGLFGSGSAVEIYSNTTNWVTLTGGKFWDQTFLSTSYSTLLSISDSPLPILNFVSSRVLSTVLWIIPVLIRTTQLMALAGLVAAWLQPHSATLARNVALLVGAHLATQSPGGYTLAFLIFAVFLETSHRPGVILALIAAYTLSINYDVMLTTVVDTNSPSWLSGRNAHIAFGLAVGQFVRPAMVLLIVWGLAIDSVTQSILAHRTTRPSLGLAFSGVPALG